MLKNTLLLLTLFFSIHILSAQQTASQLLDKSIAYHDPNDNWDSFEGELLFTVLFPGRPDAKRTVMINNKKSKFVFLAPYDDGTLKYVVEKNVPIALWNNAAEIPAEAAKKHKIKPERATMYRDYYTYLYGMPMKLKDPGTIINPKVEAVSFHGKEYNRIRVTYDKGVGNDIWYFYFNPKSNALEAYQFFHDESKNDGEYILFEGEKLIDGVKIPKDRVWYYNEGAKYLATDVLE